MASVIGAAPALMNKLYLVVLTIIFLLPIPSKAVTTLSETVLSDARQIPTAVASLPANGGTVIVQNAIQSGIPKIILTRNNVTIKFINSQIGFSSAGIEVEGANDSILADNASTFTSGDVAFYTYNATNALFEGIHVTQSANSAFMLEGKTVGAKFLYDTAVNYNQNNHTGQAGFFIYGPVANILFQDCSATNGNGNGFRMDSPSTLPQNVRVIDCDVENTWGHSAEGITPAGDNIWIVNCRIYKATTTGILVWNGHSGTTYHNIFLLGNSIGDSSQEIAGNAGIQINPQANGIQGVVISNNLVWDDQATPTSYVMLSLTNSGQGGAIDSLTVTGNTFYNQRNPIGVSDSIPAGLLTNSSFSLSSAF